MVASDPPEESRKKCALGWYVFAGVSLIFVITHSIALISGSTQQFHILEMLKRNALYETFVLRLILVFVVFLVVAALTFVIGLILVWRADDKQWKNDKQLKHELWVYCTVVIAVIALSTSAGTYFGMFSAIPFVVFAIGATQTRRPGFFFLTCGIHFATYVVLTHVFQWGIARDIRTLSGAEQNYWATIAVAYICVIFPKLLHLYGDRIPHFLAVKFGTIDSPGTPIAKAARAENTHLSENVAKSQLGTAKE